MKISKIVSLTEDQWALVCLSVRNALMENPLMISSMDSGYNIIDEISSAKTISSKGVICKDCRQKLERDFEI